METTPNTPSGFAATGLCSAVLSAITELNFTTPTPIQAEAIPVALKGTDMIGVAQTGTGKTLAFSLPLIERLMNTRGRGLILVPTRELALQVEEVIQQVTEQMNDPMPTAVLIGGASMPRQVGMLRRNPRVIVATPGRLQDHLQQRTVNLGTVNTLILDEADRMLDMGFINQIKRIVELVPKDRQTMLFSATMSAEVTRLAQEYMINPVRIEVAKSGTAAELIEQQLCYVTTDRKSEVLRTLLNQYDGPVLVFSRTKHGASKLSRSLAVSGFSSAEIHANKSLGQRRQALDGFKSGQYRVLVATDLAARGIDVQDIALVVNYDLPDAPADYVHRIGRTGRAGKSGLAISLASHDQYNDVRTIERLINVTLPLSEHSEQRQSGVPQSSSSSFGRRSFGGGGGGDWADRTPAWRQNRPQQRRSGPMGVGASRGSR